MFCFVSLPDVEEIRVYCALAFASMTLDAFYRVHKLKPGDSIPENKKIKITRANEQDLPYLWTALMMLGPTGGRPGFSEKTIEIRNVHQKYGSARNKSSFDPKSQLAADPFAFFKLFSKSNASSADTPKPLSSKFKSTSYYQQKFLPVLGKQEVKYDEEEQNKPFGHQIPEDKEKLKLEVAFYLAESMRVSYFFDERPRLRYRGDPYQLESLHAIGFVKLAQMLHMLNSEIFKIVDLSQSKLGEFGYKGCFLILAVCERTKELVLDGNCLHLLAPTAEDHWLYLCTVLGNISPSVKVVTLRNNGLASFNKEQLMAVMRAIPVTVKEVFIENNHLSKELEKELLNSRALMQKNSAGLLPALQNQTLISEDTVKKEPIGIGSNVHTHFGASSAMQQRQSSSAPNSYDDVSFSSNSSLFQ